MRINFPATNAPQTISENFLSQRFTVFSSRKKIARRIPLLIPIPAQFASGAGEREQFSKLNENIVGGSTSRGDDAASAGFTRRSGGARRYIAARLVSVTEEFKCSFFPWKFLHSDRRSWPRTVYVPIIISLTCNWNRPHTGALIAS